MSNTPDQLIIEEIKKSKGRDKERAFELIYKKYKDKVFNTAYRIVGDQYFAADITQEVFFTVFKKAEKIRFRSSFKNWLYRVTINFSIDKKRKGFTKKATFSFEDFDKVPENRSFELIDRKSASPEELFGEQEFEGKVQEAIGKLSPKLRAAITLRYNQELSYSEIGKTLKCSVGTVKSRLNRAHRALQPYLIRLIGRYKQDRKTLTNKMLP